MGGEQTDRRQVQPPIRDGFEQNGKEARRTGRLDPLVGGVLGVVELLDTVGEQRRIARSGIGSPRVDLGDVRQEHRRGLPVL